MFSTHNQRAGSNRSKRSRTPDRDPSKNPRLTRGTNLQPKALALVDKANDLDTGKVELPEDDGLQKAYLGNDTKGWAHMCGDKCKDPLCPYLRAPSTICRSMAKHGHCRFQFFSLLHSRPNTGTKYTWAARGCKHVHYVAMKKDLLPTPMANGVRQQVQWFCVKEDCPRLTCAEKLCASEEAWIKLYDDEHNKDVAARIQGEAKRDQRAVEEVLGDSVKVQARAAKEDKIKARREGTGYDPVERADKVAEHLNAMRQVKAESGTGGRKFNLFKKK